MTESQKLAIRMWSFKQLDDVNRKYAGNSGYTDVLGKSYHWNSKVGNYGKPRISDFIVIIDNDNLLGISRIDSIQEADGKVISFHCPKCIRSGSFKPRVSDKFSNKYRCEKCFFEGNEPLERLNDVKEFEAGYETYWREINNLKVSELRELFVAKSLMNSIRELDFVNTKALIEGRFNFGEFFWGGKPIDSKLPSGSKVVLMKQRIGQSKFRSHLLNKYGNVCAISGTNPMEVLEAAHLYRYSEREVHDPEGGLLFRRDLHTLFDRWLLTIDPSDLTIHVSPTLSQFPEIFRYHGGEIKVPKELAPKSDYLKIHFEISNQSWS
jgi:predicted RNA-binding Zn-ribbon protein involved in translation (DUF1610 family)